MQICVENLKKTFVVKSGGLFKPKKRQNVKNAKLSPQNIEDFCKLNEDGRELLQKSVERYGFSPRAIASCLKVARTIADMEEKEFILPVHLAEAIDFRKLCSNLVPEI